MLPVQIYKQDPTLRTIEQQEDMLVARVVLSSRIPVEDQRPDSDRSLCYRVLELLQSAFPAMGQNTRDFIRFPKENMYMALHAPIRIKGFPSPIQVQVGQKVGVGGEHVRRRCLTCSACRTVYAGVHGLDGRRGPAWDAHNCPR